MQIITDDVNDEQKFDAFIFMKAVLLVVVAVLTLFCDGLKNTSYSKEPFQNIPVGDKIRGDADDGARGVRPGRAGQVRPGRAGDRRGHEPAGDQGRATGGPTGGSRARRCPAGDLLSCNREHPGFGFRVAGNGANAVRPERPEAGG